MYHTESKTQSPGYPLQTWDIEMFGVNSGERDLLGSLSHLLNGLNNQTFTETLFCQRWITCLEPEEYGTWSYSFRRLCRVTGYIWCLIQRVHFKYRFDRLPFLTTEKLTLTENVLVKVSQRKFYSSVISYLQTQESLKSKHRYSNMPPLIV